MSRDLSPFGVRIPTNIKAQLQKSATRNIRSINAEIVFRLSESLGATGGPLSGYTDGDLIKELLSRYERGAIYIRIGTMEVTDA